MSQRGVDEIKRILASGIQAPGNQGMDKDTQEVIARLYDDSLSDADISSCISILEMLLLLEGLPPLLSLLKSNTYNMSLRRQAAKAIAVIGSNHVAGELETLRSSSIPELTLLAEIALGIKRSNSP